MSRGRTIVMAVGVVAAVAVGWSVSRRAEPPEIPFVKVTRETIVSTLSTNGKVDPIEWASARAERAGVVKQVFVQRGQQVNKGAPLVALDVPEASAQLSNAAAQIAQARAQQQALNQGGPSLERAEINSELERARADLQAAQKEAAALERLVAKQAAPQVDLTAAKQRVEQLQLQIQGLEQRKKALVASTDQEIAQARIQQAEAAENLARSTLSLGIVRSPIAGTVYQFDLRIGSFVNAGDLVANIGKLDRVRVTVYVDEPELGRVRIDAPVTITWDALPDRRWKGVVDRLPTQIVPLGSRQVGEVGCVIDNPDHDLLPGTNINAEIQAGIVTNALAIPRVALRREGDQNGVFLLQGDHVVWRPVQLGVSSYIKVQVKSGLEQGDSVALPSDHPIRDGSRVRPVYQ